MTYDTRTYTELSKFQTFDSRFDYLMLEGKIGVVTFGFDRWINQKFYASRQWKDVRDRVIVRDQGCDLGIPGYEIHSTVLIHHINPLEPKDISDNLAWILEPEFLITTTLDTHNAIHYGDKSRLRQPYVERVPGDTRLW